MTTQPPPHVDQALLLPLVRTGTASPHLRMDGWQMTTISVQGQRSIYRFAGTGEDDGALRPWSLILKVIRAPVHRDMLDWDPLNWVYWEREYQLYAAGIPQTLTGDLQAPRCYGVAQPSPDQRWIWLEDLHDQYERNWSIERYRLAARQLGAFNGVYLTGKPLPTLDCLGGDRLRSRSADMIADFDRLRDPALWAHPRLRRVTPQPILSDLERLLAEREEMLALLTHFPQTFCHLDVHVGNMAARRADNGTEVTTLFDWAIAGYAAPGQEIANLIWSAFVEFKLPISQAAMLEAAVLDGYLQGLADVGWQADPQVVRCAYLIASLLVFGLRPEAVEHAWNEAEHAALERYYGWSIDDIIAQAAEVTHLLLDRAHQLRTLLNRL